MASSDDEDVKSDASSRTSGGGKKPTMQLSPLQIRFSQKKMRNVFGDSKLVEDSVTLIQAVRRSKEDAELYDAAYKLEAPFPPVEVIRWRSKLRDENTGRPLLNERGKEMFEAEESWFTLDNRRLFCLQKAALKLLPENCTADVIAEVRKDRRMREIRKFRTMDNGQSVMVGSVVDGVPFERWDWRAEHANPNRTTADRLVPPTNRKGTGKGKKGKGGCKSGESGGKGGKSQDGKGYHSKGYQDGGTNGANDGGAVGAASGAGGFAFDQFAAAFSGTHAKGGGGKSSEAGSKGGKGGKGKHNGGYGGYGGYDGYCGYDSGKGSDYYQYGNGDQSKGGKSKSKGGGGGGGKDGGGGKGGKGSRKGGGKGGGKNAQSQDLGYAEDYA